MNHQETCKACDEAYKACQVDILREAFTKAHVACEEAKIAYQKGREAYYAIYRKLWRDYRS